MGDNVLHYLTLVILYSLLTRITQNNDIRISRPRNIAPVPQFEKRFQTLET